MPAKKISKAKTSASSVGELILKAVSNSKERNGMSLSALKKALAAGGYDVEKNKARVKTAIRNLVKKGTLVQVKGFGASASFKINQGAAEPAAKKPRGKKAGRKVRKSVAKKPAKKAAAKKRASAKKSPKKAMQTRAAKKAATGSKRPTKRVAKKAAVKKAAKSRPRRAASKTGRR